jgi:phosphohistidine phosphatase SixA
MHIKQVLEAISKDLPTVFLIRHAKRFSTTNIEEDFKCPLTPEGREDAKQLGEIFANNIGQINKIVSSPVGRCIETASNIAKGSANHIEVEQWQDLERAYGI